MGGDSGEPAARSPRTLRKRGRDPSPATQRAVWARSGGICARPGCGVVLYEDPVFFKTRPFGELAHNVAASPDGPRGDAKRSPQQGQVQQSSPSSSHIQAAAGSNAADR